MKICLSVHYFQVIISGSGQMAADIWGWGKSFRRPSVPGWGWPSWINSMSGIRFSWRPPSPLSAYFHWYCLWRGPLYFTWVRPERVQVRGGSDKVFHIYFLKKHLKEKGLAPSSRASGLIWLLATCSTMLPGDSCDACCFRIDSEYSPSPYSMSVYVSSLEGEEESSSMTGGSNAV